MSKKYQKLLEELDSCIIQLEELGKVEYEREVLPNLVKIYNKAVELADNLYQISGITDTQIENIDAKLDRVEVLYDRIVFFAFNNALNRIDKDEKRQKAIEKKIDSQQGLQLTIFSIVIAIISFILNNTKVLSIENVDLKTVLLVNVSFILAVSILFALIYIFMGYNFEHKKWKYLFLILFPLLMIIALVLIGLLL